jgi:hypothetical protein
MTAFVEPLPLQHSASASSASDAILDYLQHHLQGYPFDLELDSAFVAELLDDFPRIDILAQIKVWRWYYDGHPPLERRPRAALRRWFARAQR